MSVREALSQIIGGIVVIAACCSQGWNPWAAIALIIGIKMLDNQDWKL